MARHIMYLIVASLLRRFLRMHAQNGFIPLRRVLFGKLALLHLVIFVPGDAQTEGHSPRCDAVALVDTDCLVAMKRQERKGGKLYQTHRTLRGFLSNSFAIVKLCRPQLLY